MPEGQAYQTNQSIPTEPNRITVDDFLTLSGDQPAEIVNGEIVYMSPNQRGPARPAKRLLMSLNAYVEENDLGEVWTEVAHILNADPKTNWVYGARQPDVSFVTKERIEPHDAEYGPDGPIRLAPDIAVEVISPTDAYSDVTTKIHEYLDAGVRLVVIIDPKTRKVWTYTLDNRNGTLLTDTDTLTGDPVLPGWSMSVAELLG